MWTDEVLREWALATLRLATDREGSVRERLAQERNVSPETARDVIARARRRGYLATVAKQGVRDFRPGPLLQESAKGQVT